MEATSSSAGFPRYAAYTRSTAIPRSCSRTAAGTEKSLTELETELNPDEFFRVNRQTIVNIDRIRKISPTDGRDSAVSLTVPWSDLSFVITAERKKELLRILDC